MFFDFIMKPRVSLYELAVTLFGVIFICLGHPFIGIAFPAYGFVLNRIYNEIFG